MTSVRTFAIGALGLALLSPAAGAQDLSRYRAFELGGSVASVVTATGVPETQVTILHQRPALLQGLEWRPSRWARGSAVPATDPVDQIGFSFYEDHLFQIVVNYGHDRTEGLTDADVIEAISTMYGARLQSDKPPADRVQSRGDTEAGAVIARWADADHDIALYRTPSYGSPLRLIVTKTALETLARRAQAQAQKLDVVEAPQREIARQQQERERERAAAEKARTVNKPAFRP
jgi:hypothetical protein